MRTRVMFAMMIIVALGLCLAASQPAIAASDEEEVLEAVQNSSKALSSRDYDLMSSFWLHSPDTSFFGGGGENAFLTRGWKNVDVFIRALSGIPEDVMSFSSHNTQVTMLSDNAAIVTGYAIMIFNPPDTNERSINHSRFTHVLKKVHGKWLTVHSHWSMFPAE